MQFIEEIHETCSLVNGPEESGEFSDVNFGIAGEIQPITVPCDRRIKFADWKKKLTLQSQFIR